MPTSPGTAKAATCGESGGSQIFGVADPVGRVSVRAALLPTLAGGGMRPAGGLRPHGARRGGQRLPLGAPPGRAPPIPPRPMRTGRRPGDGRAAGRRVLRLRSPHRRRARGSAGHTGLARFAVRRAAASSAARTAACTRGSRRSAATSAAARGPVGHFGRQSIRFAGLPGRPCRRGSAVTRFPAASLDPRRASSSSGGLVRRPTSSRRLLGLLLPASAVVLLHRLRIRPLACRFVHRRIRRRVGFDRRRRSPSPQPNVASGPDSPVESSSVRSLRSASARRRGRQSAIAPPAPHDEQAGSYEACRRGDTHTRSHSVTTLHTHASTRITRCDDCRTIRSPVCCGRNCTATGARHRAVTRSDDSVVLRASQTRMTEMSTR